MTIAGHGTTLKTMLASTAMVGEACANSDAGAYLKYQVSASARRLIDLGQAVVVYVDGVAQPVTAYRLNPLFGIITFEAALLVGNVVTIDAYYGTLSALLEVRELTLSMSRTMLEKTSFDSGGVKQRMAGLKDANGSFGQLSSIHDDIDSGGGTAYLDTTYLDAGVPLVLEAVFGSGAGETFRAMVLLESEEQKVNVDDLVDASVNWNAALPAPATAGLRVSALFAFDNWS